MMLAVLSWEHVMAFYRFSDVYMMFFPLILPFSPFLSISHFNLPFLFFSLFLFLSLFIYFSPFYLCHIFFLFLSLFYSLICVNPLSVTIACFHSTCPHPCSFQVTVCFFPLHSHTFQPSLSVQLIGIAHIHSRPFFPIDRDYPHLG